ncbi:MAG: hypothetical protein AB8B51_01365 [Sedimentitalea sp.]
MRQSAQFTIKRAGQNTNFRHGFPYQPDLQHPNRQHGRNTDLSKSRTQITALFCSRINLLIGLFLAAISRVQRRLGCGIWAPSQRLHVMLSLPE